MPFDAYHRSVAGRPTSTRMEINVIQTTVGDILSKQLQPSDTHIEKFGATFVTKCMEELRNAQQQMRMETRISVAESKARVQRLSNQFKDVLDEPQREAMELMVSQIKDSKLYYSNPLNRTPKRALIVYASYEELLRGRMTKMIMGSVSTHIADVRILGEKLLQRFGIETVYAIVCQTKEHADAITGIQNCVALRPGIGFNAHIPPLLEALNANAVLQIGQEKPNLKEVAQVRELLDGGLIYFFMKAEEECTEHKTIQLETQLRQTRRGAVEFLREFQDRLQKLRKQNELFPFWRFQMSLWCHRAW